jgi:hypothetical protein
MNPPRRALGSGAGSHGDGVPDLNLAIPPGGGQPGAVGRPGKAADLVRVAAERDRPAAGRLPHAHIATPGGQPVARRRPGEALDGFGVSAENSHRVIGRPPQVDPLRVGPPPAWRRAGPRQGIHRRPEDSCGARRATGHGIPDLDDAEQAGGFRVGDLHARPVGGPDGLQAGDRKAGPVGGPGDMRELTPTVDDEPVGVSAEGVAQPQAPVV